MNKPYLHDDWETIKGSKLLSVERVAEIETEITHRTHPLVTSGGTPVERAYTLTHPDGRRYLVQTTEYVTLERHQRDLIAALLTPDELDTLNDLASSRWAAQREVSDYAKATKVSDREYESGVWWGNDYFGSMEDFLDKLMWSDNEIKDIPEYVWAATPTLVIPELNVADVVEHYVCDRGWEDMDYQDLNGVTELQAALDAFTKANEGVVSYLPDHKLAVVISPETRAELVAQIEEAAK